VRGDTRVKSIKVTVMSKNRSSVFSEKIGVTPSVSAPGDTNPSDATGWGCGLTVHARHVLQTAVGYAHVEAQ